MSLNAGKTAEHGALELHFKINISRLESLTTRFALTAADVKKSNFFKLPETYFMLKGSQAL